MLSSSADETLRRRAESLSQGHTMTESQIVRAVADFTQAVGPLATPLTASLTADFAKAKGALSVLCSAYCSQNVLCMSILGCRIFI